MLGAIIGDVIGSPYERKNIKVEYFQLFSKSSKFTDDTVMTFATALALLRHLDYSYIYWTMGRKFPGRGYGKAFQQWLMSKDRKPYNSFGNGSAMRASPIGYVFNDVEKVLEEAKNSAIVTHDHPEGIKGAQAVALAVFMARTGASKDEIRGKLIEEFNYNIERTCPEIRPVYKFDSSCQGSVPEALIAFFDSENFEDAIRKAVSLGGDSDTIASIAGSIAEAYYKVIPQNIARGALYRLPHVFLRILRIFYNTFEIHTKFK